MPELPEVETIRRELDRDVVGRRIKAVEVGGMRSVRRHPNKRHFAEKLQGTKISGVLRRGKYLVLRLDSGDALVIHLGMSGQLLRMTTKASVAEHTHVRITFTQGGQLRFVDPRTFGEMFVTAADDLDDEIPELSELGVDPVEQPMAWTHFGEMLLSKKAKLKPLLMDQKFIAGLGNIYSDEILFNAGLRFDRTTDSLSTQEIRRLYRALVETLHDAIKYRGSTLSDDQYLDLHGAPGEFQTHHNVYAREGEACRRCRTPVARTRVNSRSTFYCEQCQV